MQLWRGSFLLLPILAAAWAAGCSDSDPVTAAPAVDAGNDSDPASKKASPDPCSGQIDADGLAKVLSCSGLYTDIKAKTVSPDALAYKPSTEFWSDGAAKSRWILIPAGKQIDTSDMNEWIFPDGTKVWKEFKLGGKRIETRIFAKSKGDWSHTSYRWNDDETEATRIAGGALIVRTDDAGAPSGDDAGVYEIPEQNACQECHIGRKDSLLGFDAVSLGLPGATGVTLAKLIDDKKLTVDPAKKDLAYPTASAPAGGDKAAPAIAWLHANCASCHNDNATASAFQTVARFQLKASELLGTPTTEELQSYKSIVCKDSFRDETAGVPYKYVRSGNATRSLVSILSGRRTTAGQGANEQMPPLATHIIDPVGHKLLDDWITSLTPPCP